MNRVRFLPRYLCHCTLEAIGLDEFPLFLAMLIVQGLNKNDAEVGDFSLTSISRNACIEVSALGAEAVHTFEGDDGYIFQYSRQHYKITS